MNLRGIPLDIFWFVISLGQKYGKTISSIIDCFLNIIDGSSIGRKWELHNNIKSCKSLKQFIQDSTCIPVGNFSVVF